MKIYLVSLAAGLLVGVIYGLINVRSPAPPVVALVGLLGILLGEQLVPVARHLFGGSPETVGSLLSGCKAHVLGELPSRPAAGAPARQPVQPGVCDEG